MTKICIVCNKEFEAINDIYTMCSNECRAIHKKKMQKEWYEKHKNLATSDCSTPKNCKVCGKEFIPYRYNVVTCSDECKKIKHKYDMRAYRTRTANKPIIKNRKSTLDKTIKELDKYNELNGTRLTYGKFVGLRALGKI